MVLLLAYVVAEVGDIQQFFQKADDEIEHGMAPWFEGGDGACRSTSPEGRIGPIRIAAMGQELRRAFAFTIIGAGWIRTSAACLPSDASGALPLSIADLPSVGRSTAELPLR